MKIKNLKLIYSIFLIFITISIYANNLIINGLSKLTIKDLQTQTNINLKKISYSDDEINTLLKDLYKSDLIFDLTYNKDNVNHVLFIQENKLIEEIFINGNQRFEDELILQNLKMK